MRQHLTNAAHQARPATTAQFRLAGRPRATGHHISVRRILRRIAQLPYRHNDVRAVVTVSPVHVRMRMTALHEANIVELSGEIDAATAVEFWIHLECVPTVEDVVLDLSGVRFMGAAGLTLLLRFQRRLTEADATLRLTGVSPLVRTVITLVNLEDVLVCLPSTTPV